MQTGFRKVVGANESDFIGRYGPELVFLIASWRAILVPRAGQSHEILEPQ
jgi:hypothetical protein